MPGPFLEGTSTGKATVEEQQRLREGAFVSTKRGWMPGWRTRLARAAIALIATGEEIRSAAAPQRVRPAQFDLDIDEPCQSDANPQADVGIG